jgi:hypothetical protein
LYASHARLEHLGMHLAAAEPAVLERIVIMNPVIIVLCAKLACIQGTAFLPVFHANRVSFQMVPGLLGVKFAPLDRIRSSNLLIAPHVA